MFSSHFKRLLIQEIMLTSRQKQLLTLIIADYVNSAEPVGSSSLVNKYKLKMSSATIRNEMGELEKRGYIIKPHASAGRMPSEKAYIWFVEKRLEYHKSVKLQKVIEELLTKGVYEQAIKNVAKLVAQLSGQAVIVGFKFNHAYYTGLSNLFRHPEFQEYGQVVNLTATIDRMDDMVSRLFDEVKDDVRIFIGHNNPFGSQTSLIITKYKYKDREPGVFALLGPVRMDYNKNYSLIKQTKEVIQQK